MSATSYTTYVPVPLLQLLTTVFSFFKYDLFTIMFLRLCLFGVGLPVLVAAAEHSSSYIASIFSPSLSPGAQIFLPTDVNYTEEVNQRWTTFAVPSFIGTIKPATERDIQNIVSLIRTLNRVG
jgi:hypothetical protein